MDGLDFGIMLDEDEMESLFGEQEDSQPEDKEGDDEDNTDDTAEDDSDNSDDEDDKNNPESVGSEDNKDKEDTSDAEDGTSPDFYSSIANAFAEEGIFPDLDEATIKGIKNSQDFRNAIEEQIKAGLDEQQRRVVEALDNNVEPNVIRGYENIISYLDTISEESLNDESEEGEDLRKRILFQDYVNRGFSKERAEKAVTRAINNGTDLEEAKEALESNKTFFREEYQKVLKEAKEAEEQEKQETIQRAERIKKNILEGDLKFFGDIDIDKNTRQAAFDAISKPVYKDPKTGATYTAIQKMEMDNREEFLAKLGLMYALTNGMKSIDGLVKKKAKKEVKKGFSELERKINSTSRDSNGNLRFASGVNDTNFFLGQGVELDL